MKFDEDLYVAAVGSWLPDTVSLSDAVQAGLVDAEHRDIGYDSIGVARDISGPEMAVRAGRAAVARSGLGPDDIGLVLNASCGYQGLEMWPAAAYVANQTVGAAVPGIDLQQRCSAGTSAIALAAGYLTTGFATAALLTSGDNFAAPWVDRWNVQLNLIFADGAGALVLSRQGGFARLLSTSMGAENSLEPWNRGDSPFTTMPGQEIPLRLRERAMQAAASPEAEGAWERYEAALMRTVDQAVADAGVTIADISKVTLPFIHRGVSPENYEVLGFHEKQSTWDLGRRTGHVGAADPFLGLEHLVREDAIGPGDLVLMAAAGAGFSFSASVLEILDVPRW
jgi:3-oxoacyl-[acyl-carrier-protein] synthase-3